MRMLTAFDHDVEISVKQHKKAGDGGRIAGGSMPMSLATAIRVSPRSLIRRYPRLRIPARIGRLPLIGPLLPLGLGVLAANRRFLFDRSSRIFWLKATVTIAFCIGLIMSSRLWIGPRSYPLTPVSGILPSLAHPLDYLLFAALFALAVPIVILPKPQRFIGAFLTIILVSCLLDQTRWQPWVYLYGFLLATFALFSWNSDDAVGQRRAMNIARLIIASTYIFSGLQKANLNFIESDFPWMVQPITNLFPRLASPLHLLGMSAPFIQVGFGVGLLTKKYRRASLVLAVSMHVFILTMFGPLGHAWNSIIWPWTATMAVLDIVLFSSDEEFTLREIFWTKGNPYQVMVILLFALLPFLSFFNLWDSYLSAALYSGNLTEAEIYASDVGRDALPEAVKARLVHTSPNTNVLNIQRWAAEDLNVMPYPETRVYKQITSNVCQQARDPTQIILIVRERRMFRSKPEVGYRCRDL